MRLPWVSRRKYDELDLILSHECENRDEYLHQCDEARSYAFMVERQRDDARKGHAEACKERDEALARVADLERALGQFSAGEAADIQAARDNLPDEAKITYGLGGSRQTGDHADLCDCAVSNWNEHRVGHCGTAHREAALAGMFMSTDCTCPPGWKHRATDCPFNPNPEREHRQRYG